jgi:hypothetical protein
VVRAEHRIIVIAANDIVDKQQMTLIGAVVVRAELGGG